MRRSIGLTTEQAMNNRKMGSNKLFFAKKESFWYMFKESLDIRIKIFIFLLSLEEIGYLINCIWPNIGFNCFFNVMPIFMVMAIILFVSTFISYVQKSSILTLYNEGKKKVKVYRDRRLIEVHIDDIVQDDCILLQPGSKIPADGVLIEGSLDVEQVELNGTKRKLEKSMLDDNVIPGNDEFMERFMCFRGSFITAGFAIMQVTEVGENTRLALQLKKEERQTRSNKKVSRLEVKVSVLKNLGIGMVALSYLIHMSQYTIGNIGYHIFYTLILAGAVNLLLQEHTMIKYTQKCIAFQLSTFIITVLGMMLGSALGYIEGIFPIIQILLIGFIINSLAPVAFAKESVREKDKNPISCKSLGTYLENTILISIWGGIISICLGISLCAQNMEFVFALCVMNMIYHAFNVRTESMNLLEHITQDFILFISVVSALEVTLIQFGEFLGSTPLPLNQWEKIFLVSFLIIPINFLHKFIVKRKG